MTEPTRPSDPEPDAGAVPDASRSGLLFGDRPASATWLAGLAVGTLVLFGAAIWMAAPKPPYRPADVGPAARAWEPGSTSGSEVGSTPEALEQKVGALCDQGRALAGQGLLQQALVPLLEARRLAPDSPEVHQYLSNVYYMSGQLEPALAEVEQALALNPDNQLYRRNAAALRQELSRRAQGPRT